MTKDGQTKIKCPVCFKTDAFYFGRRKGHELYKSAFCGLVFLWPIPADTSYIYGESYFYGGASGYGYTDYEKDKEPMRAAFERHIAEIEKYTRGRGRLLDIGAASGYFIGLAQKAGWQASGIEISDLIAAKARQRGLDVATGTLKNASFSEGQFDAITMWDVFEHFADPEDDLRRAAVLLKRGGTLAINTPDSASMSARLLGKWWYLIIPPEHLFLFNRKSLSMVLQRNGFEVVAYKKFGKLFSLAYIFGFLHTWTGWELFRKTARICERGILSRIAIPLNPRDNMFVLARKI